MLKEFNWKEFVAEFCGTLVLVLLGCGVAVVSGVNLVATALAFGLVIVAMAYTIGPISGCHINPAVSLAMAINGRISWGKFAWYVLAQITGAIVGAGLLYAIILATGNDVAGIAGTGLGQNGFAAQHPSDIKVWGALLVEILLTFIFVATIMVSTSKTKGANKKAGLIIGLTLTLVHLFGIGLTGTSVNPARSFGPALLLLGEPIKQVWVFIVAPLIGGALAALFTKFVIGSEDAPKISEDAPKITETPTEELSEE
ncbi:MAG: MIP family channel protein [Clostridiaceae bacterium]|jgi:aquaporin Z|nr:MIP family channel protein [Clostridiaceae bacterium]